MFAWLLRLLGLSRPDHLPTAIVVEVDGVLPEPGDGANTSPVMHLPDTGAKIVLDEALGIVEAPWLSQVPVESLEPSIIRRHAQKALDALEDDDHSPADRAYLERLRRLVRANQLDLPPFPDVARELDELLKETTTDILQIARVVERDPGLVRRVWTQARSALYASPPRSLHHAVARVGLDALWRIGMSVCLNDTVLRVEGFEDEAARLRVLGIVTAEVAAQLGNEKRGSLYMAGLLHDVGRLLALRAAGETRGNGPPSGRLVASAQNAVGAHLAVLVADSWGLDDAVAVGVGYSAHTDQAPDRYRKAAKTARAATIAAHTADLRRAGAYLGDVDPAAEIQSLGFDPVRSLDRATEVMDQLMQTEASETAAV